MARKLIADDVWRLLQPHLPSHREHEHGGRPSLQDRNVLTGIVFVLKTGIRWDDLPEEMGCGCGMTCLRRLRDWHQRSVWEKIQPILKNRLEYADHVDWERADVDIQPRRSVRRPRSK